MDKLDPFEGEDDGSDQEAPPTTSTSLPTEATQPAQQEKVTPLISEIAPFPIDVCDQKTFVIRKW